jgi:uncharacterized membrane protein SpoIIM required for sporulation
MKQRVFETQNEPRWAEFETLIEQLDRRGRARPPGRLRDQLADFPAFYLRVCRDLAVATERRYSPRLVDRLNRLTLAGHRVLYTKDLNLAERILRSLGLEFARAVRRDRLPMLAAAGLFLVPAVVIFALIQLRPELVYSLMDAADVRNFESMYDPAAEHIGSDRKSADDLMMFGFYIFNNISIAFRAFAGGILLGLGSAVVLVLNGLLLGGVASHVVHLGFEQTFFSFVIGHGAFELTAIVISGAAGLKLGWAIAAPGPRTRRASLRRAARESMELVYGAFAMLVMAALFEAFWSSKASIPSELKFAVGAALWALVFLYFVIVGRPLHRAQGSV